MLQRGRCLLSQRNYSSPSSFPVRIGGCIRKLQKSFDIKLPFVHPPIDSSRFPPNPLIACCVFLSLLYLIVRFSTVNLPHIDAREKPSHPGHQLTQYPTQASCCLPSRPLLPQKHSELLCQSSTSQLKRSTGTFTESPCPRCRCFRQHLGVAPHRTISTTPRPDLARHKAQFSFFQFSHRQISLCICST